MISGRHAGCHQEGKHERAGKRQEERERQVA
jgi:hypothetical protein